MTGVVEPIPPSPSLPRAALSSAASSQYHAQDELGNTAYGYSNTNSAKHEVRKVRLWQQSVINILI